MQQKNLIFHKCSCAPVRATAHRMHRRDACATSVVRQAWCMMWHGRPRPSSVAMDAAAGCRYRRNGRGLFNRVKTLGMLGEKNRGG
jgi:hypothetical protein